VSAKPDLPDAERAWAAIKAECLRKLPLADKRRAIERAVAAFLGVLSDYNRAGGNVRDTDRLKGHVLEIVRLELRANPKPTVRNALTFARDKLVRP